MEPEAMEILADAEHASWAHWMDWQFSQCTVNEDGSFTIPPGLVKRWQRQAATPYAELTEREKESDRNEVRRALEALTRAGYQIVPTERLSRLQEAVALLNSMVLCGEQHSDTSREAVRAALTPTQSESPDRL